MPTRMNVYSTVKKKKEEKKNEEKPRDFSLLGITTAGDIYIRKSHPSSSSPLRRV